MVSNKSTHCPGLLLQPFTFFSVSHGTTHAGGYIAPETSSSCGGIIHAFHKQQSPIAVIATYQNTCAACHTIPDKTTNCHQNI